MALPTHPMRAYFWLCMSPAIRSCKHCKLHKRALWFSKSSTQLWTTSTQAGSYPRTNVKKSKVYLCSMSFGQCYFTYHHNGPPRDHPVVARVGWSTGFPIQPCADNVLPHDLEPPLETLSVLPVCQSHSSRAVIKT